jgi:hypothetical protein
MTTTEYAKIVLMLIVLLGAMLGSLIYLFQAVRRFRKALLRGIKR